MNAVNEESSAEIANLQRLVRRLRQLVCSHKFYTEDISKDYVKPVMPEGLSICAEYKHPAHTKRVCWPCGKCGKKFYAHCGLDIVDKHGKWSAYHAPKNRGIYE